ncbi:hypothetical protein KBC80_05515 [Candidatus Woesebacteria bacterium]|nr:hypothetical protein [Candidatus Paceibacterota bacterium]MBP9814613.1 hypothetical protein [Candidatus Woesebacteria bacterium]
MKISFKIESFDFENFINTLKTGEFDWVVSTHDGKTWWGDPDFSSWMVATIQKDKIVLETAWSGFIYTVFRDGRVEYQGAYMGLLAQNILPELLLECRFTGFEPVEATNYSGTLKGYWDLRNKGAIVPKKYKGWNHPFCLKERPEQIMRWHEVLGK